MPSSLTHTVSIILNNVHLHATRFSLTLNVTIVACMEVAGVWGDKVKVIVD